MTSKEILNKQRIYFFENKTKSIAFRKAQLLKLKSILSENIDLLNEAIYKDFSKSAFETFETELSLVFSELNKAIKKLKKWSKPKRKLTNLANLPGRSYQLPEPLGNALIIGAWNYPLLLTLSPMIAAVAAGNTVILKPSEISKHTSNALAKIINENFKPDYIRVIEGGVKETSELLELKFDKIFFTGSPGVGKIVYQAAAKHLTPVTLELGGKSPAFIFADADLKMTARRIVWGKFLNAGQTCVATDYILTEKSIENQLIKEIKLQIEKYHNKIDDIPENYVQIINKKHFDRLTALIDEEKVCIGGKYDRAKRLIHPTVLKNVSFEDEVMEEEVFGPILPVISFDNIDEIIKKVKSKPKPLALYVFTKNKKIYKKIHQEISFGGGIVNDTVIHFGSSSLPLGGVGNSGMGSYHGYAGFQAFSHLKSILKKPFWFEPALKYSPYSKKKLKIIKWMVR